MSTDRTEWPKWLREAETVDPHVSILENGRLVWNSGIWLDGEWRGGYWRHGVWREGEWRGGVWCGGVWYDGTWRGGVWYDGTWRAGTWYDGIWLNGKWRGGYWRNGIWRGGVWRGGVWCGGVWHDGIWLDGEWRHGEWLDARIDRLLFMASRIGIVFDSEGYATAYRSTGPDGEGLSFAFRQPEGEYYEDNLPPAGTGTSMRGIGVCSQATALTHCGIEPTAELWQVRFHRTDLLDCNGQEARIRGGTFTRIPWPFYRAPNDVTPAE